VLKIYNDALALYLFLLLIWLVQLQPVLVLRNHSHACEFGGGNLV